ncbi:MAG: HlyD family type I secretion periplasmic adaptor subunit, partial [Desulfamplus sp.]|nr:HlyD family type I secretion periplasmic adaptor subunit [Desulfamplus sp.]
MNKNKILNTNPAKYMFTGSIVILLFFGGLSAWSVYFPFEGAIIANGIVQVVGEKKMVQHLEGGIIDQIYVSEGDNVEKDDILIRLQNSGVVSNVDLLQGRLMAKLAESARLTSEIAMADEIEWPGELIYLKNNPNEDISEIMDKNLKMVELKKKRSQKKSSLNLSDVNDTFNMSLKNIKDNQSANRNLGQGKILPEIHKIMSQEEDIFFAGKANLEGKLSLNLSQILQFESKIEGLKEHLTMEQKIIANFKEELQAKKSLAQGKYIDKTQVLTLDRELTHHQGNSGKLKQDIAENLEKIEELKLNNINLKNIYRETAITRLVQVRDTIFELREQIKPQLDARKRLEIKAPISGTIINMQVNSEKSGVIRSGMPLLEIVPKNSALIISAQVNPQNITNVREGQKAKVSLIAFERRNAPPVSGKVKYISSDLVVDKIKSDHYYYEVYVEVSDAELSQNNVYLSPGMPAICYITTEKRNIISYLIEPILKNIDQA